MTAISAPRGYVRTTHFERALLWTSVTLDHFVAYRLERRAGAAERRVAAAQTAAASHRAAADAHAAWGLLPR